MSNTGTDFDYLYFETYNNFYYLSFGIFNNVFGQDIVFDDSNSSFSISYTEVTLGESSPASIFFLNNFIKTGFNGDIHNPFTYDFTYTEDLVYLHITNSIGEVATFYANNLSKEEFLKQSIAMYPNPVQDILNIKSTANTIEGVKIYDLQGRLATVQQWSNETQLDLSHLQQGVYVVEIQTTAGVLREKLVKK